MTRIPMFQLLVCLVHVVSLIPAASAHQVYWDISHGVGDNYQPSGRYSILVDHLNPLGFDFTEGIVPLDTVDLSSFEILVLASSSVVDNVFTVSELAAIETFVQDGGGLLLMSEIAGSSGIPKIQQVADIFGATVGLTKYPPDDVYSTQVGGHPSVAGVDQMFFRYSSTFDPGILAPYAFYNDMPMLAAGNFGEGRAVLIGDGDLFTRQEGSWGQIFPYFDNADNRQLSESVFNYLALPEPSTFSLMVAGLVLISSRVFHKMRISGRVIV